jgi:hypothetical protein
MRLIRACVCVAVFVLSNGARAQPSDPDVMLRPHVVVLLTAKDEVVGRREANRAADRLGYPLAPDTLRKPLARRIFVGAVITLQRLAGDRFAVVSFLGDQPDALKALEKGKKYYPDARMIPAELPKGASDGWTETAFYRLGVLVLGSYKAYPEALRAAKSIGARSDYPYGSRGMVYDRERGLIWPDDSEDDIWAGAYAPRRYDRECGLALSKPCVTVERSEAYEGFTPGLYIVVGGILDRSDEREKRLAAVRKLVPAAYVKQTAIYMGCMH